MSLASGLRRWALQLGLIAGLVLLVAAVDVSPVHATTPNLSGFWVNSANTQSGYTLRESTDSSVLNAAWAGLPPHQTLQGHFKGTLDLAGDAYSGTFNVTEQGSPGSPPVSVSGSGTFALRSSFFASFPLIDVTLNPANGQPSTFRLEIFSALPLLRPDGVTEEVTCPSQQPCTGAVDFGELTGGAMSPFRPDAGSIARQAAAKNVNLGKTRFKLKPGKARQISVSLNKKGRKLLKKSGSLQVQVVIHMNKASGLPSLTSAGVVTFSK
jgi:hypothetical protein